MVFFLVMIIFFFSDMFLIFCFFKKRYFFSFLFFFPQFYFLFSSFSEKGSFFSFTFFLFDVLSMFPRIFKVFSPRKKKVVNDEIEIARGILTPLRILLDFRCSRNFSCFDWNYRALLNIRNFTRYYADIVSSNYEESSDPGYIPKLSPPPRCEICIPENDGI